VCHCPAASSEFLAPGDISIYMQRPSEIELHVNWLSAPTFGDFDKDGEMDIYGLKDKRFEVYDSMCAVATFCKFTIDEESITAQARK